jgi:hypothetical protein
MPLAYGAGELEERFVAPGVHGEIRDRDDKTYVASLMELASVNAVKTRRKGMSGLPDTDDLEAEGQPRDSAAPAARFPSRD